MAQRFPKWHDFANIKKKSYNHFLENINLHAVDQKLVTFSGYGQEWPNR